MADQLWFMTCIREEEEWTFDPIKSVIALKDNGQSMTSKANPTRLSSLTGKVKNVLKNVKYI